MKLYKKMLMMSGMMFVSVVQANPWINGMKNGIAVAAYVSQQIAKIKDNNLAVRLHDACNDIVHKRPQMHHYVITSYVAGVASGCVVHALCAREKRNPKSVRTAQDATPL